MAKLGSKKRPVVLRLQSEDRIDEVLSLCEEHGLQYILGVEPDKPEDISDLYKAINNQKEGKTPKQIKIGRNEPCPCGSGKKYKKCCGAI